MTPAPDTGRTAEEMRDFRKALALACNDPGHFVGFKGERSLGEWQVDALIAGPLAPVLAEIAQLRSRLLQAEKGAEATRWRRTGTSSHPVGGGRGVEQWFRPSDGSLQMFPTGFDPNSGTYGPAILHGGQMIYLCPGDTFVPAPDPLNPNQEAGDHEPR